MTSSQWLHHQRERAGSFGAAARDYDRHRPEYPARLIDDLVAAGADTALDVGAGTGIASRQLADRGVDVLALEPDQRMAELAAEKGIRTQAATFEEWDAAGQMFDLVLFAQSFHWVDPDAALPKVRRLLTGRGQLALAWNRIFPVSPSRSDFAPIYRDFMEPGSPLVTPTPTSPGLDVARVDDVLENAGFTVCQHTYQREAHYDRDAWLDLVFTYSNHLVLPPDKASELRNRLADYIGAAGVTAGGDALLITARPRP
ncbi:class I SAM-dependent methyltransferase [Mycolicibacterium sp. P9-64]|uniref:class I SAM-dependent methyltransferase n=1 Tax=Mycolicibacterium sp. P9-64 TaxID=2024612 RepID=UPI0011EE85ED|nr:class I SAM-dependent methyltransferase [Mycolicibacterium sp. P9-64]KAA0074205.1 class I SAM-dependent methyltransferase [Mycolicibacterium sp. P9-64]